MPHVAKVTAFAFGAVSASSSNVFSAWSSIPDGSFLATAVQMALYGYGMWSAVASSGRCLLRVLSSLFSFSPDGKYLTAASENIAQVWDTDGRVVARMSYGGEAKIVTFNPDGKYLVTADAATAWVWEVFSGRRVARISHEGEINALTFSPDLRYLVVTSFLDY